MRSLQFSSHSAWTQLSQPWQQTWLFLINMSIWSCRWWDRLIILKRVHIVLPIFHHIYVANFSNKFHSTFLISRSADATSSVRSKVYMYLVKFCQHNNHKVVKLVCQKHTTAQSLQASCSITYTILFESLSGKQFPQLSHCSALLYRCVKDLTNISLLRQHMI